jgi:uncharacterized membrane protein
MKKDFIVTSANSPLIINVSEHKATNSLVCTPNAGTYSVEYSVSPRKATTVNWVADTEIASATTQKSAEYGKVTRFRITLNAGTSVAVDLA